MKKKAITLLVIIVLSIGIFTLFYNFRTIKVSEISDLESNGSFKELRVEIRDINIKNSEYFNTETIEIKDKNQIAKIFNSISNFNVKRTTRSRHVIEGEKIYNLMFRPNDHKHMMFISILGNNYISISQYPGGAETYKQVENEEGLKYFKKLILEGMNM